MDKKKLAAAMAAVTAFINSGEAVAGGQELASTEMVAQERAAQEGPVFQMNLWGITGRQALMHSSTMMQLRMFK